MVINPDKVTDFKDHLAATYKGSDGLKARHMGGKWRLTVEQMEVARDAMGLDDLGRYNIQCWSPGMQTNHICSSRNIAHMMQVAEQLSTHLYVESLADLPLEGRADTVCALWTNTSGHTSTT